MSTTSNWQDAGPSRRDVVKTGTAAAIAGIAAPLAAGLGAARGRSDEVLRVGLVGCGGRGGGAAANALRADPNTELVALGDTFGDRVENKLRELEGTEDIGERVQVDEAQRFVGFDAYKGVVDSCDVVLLATTPFFRPIHTAYAVEQGKHLFIEKPVATDGPGVRSMKESLRRAREKGLSAVSGLCYRYSFAKQETMRRVHEGEIGDVVALECTYNTGGLWHRGRKPEWSEMEYQIRNWLYFDWLSGDHICEQHIHSLDKLAWAMQDEYPVACTASGGRTVRTDPKWGNIYDHFNTVYEWANGVKGFSSCRQWRGAKSNVSDFVYGTKGTASLQSHRIEGEQPWRWRSDEPDDMYQNEHDVLFRAIRAGESRVDDYMCDSTLMAIMGRLSAYTGERITREQALESQEDLSPPSYEWNDAVGQRPIAVPGVTKFV